MTNDLVAPEDLAGFPGAPFPARVVDAAVADLRARAGWHIAPSRTETIAVDCLGGTRVPLPSLHVTAINAVRNALLEPATDVSGYRWSKAGVLSRCWWPQGFQSLEVSLTHGYSQCPLDLLPVVVALIQAVTFDATVSQQAVGPFSVTATNLSTLGSWLDRSSESALQRYTLPSRP